MQDALCTEYATAMLGWVDPRPSLGAWLAWRGVNVVIRCGSGSGNGMGVGWRGGGGVGSETAAVGGRERPNLRPCRLLGG